MRTFDFICDECGETETVEASVCFGVDPLQLVRSVAGLLIADGWKIDENGVLCPKSHPE